MANSLRKIMNSLCDICLEELTELVRNREDGNV